MLTAFLMNIAVFGASVLLTSRYCASKSRHYRLLALAVFYYALIVFILLCWGVLGKLYLENIVLTSLLIFLICYLFFSERFVSLNLFSLPKELLNNRIVIFCLCVLLGFGLVKTAINLLNPPFGWDSLNYHFTFPVEWFKHANLKNPITINDDLAPSYYPINGSLIYLWLIAPLKNVFLADAGQIPFFIVSFLAAYGICRQLRISKEYSLYAAGLFTITPNYFKQMEIGYVDVMVCAWFLGSVYFLLSFQHQREIKDVLLSAICLGMLIGTKTAALPYGAVLCILFLIALLMHYRNSGFKKTMLIILFSCLLIIVFGGYGYIRNYAQTGNPLYPMNVHFLGKEILKGVYNKLNYSVRVAAGDYSPSKILFHEGMGAGVIVFLFPGLLLFVIGAIKRSIASLDRFLIFSLAIIMFLIWRYVIPLPNLRYLYPALALGYIAAFSALSSNKPYSAIIRIAVMLCFLASSAEISNRLELASSFLLAIILFFSFAKVYALLSRLKIKGLIFIALLGFSTLYFFNLDYNKNEYTRYIKMVKYSGFWPDAANAWGWLNENTSGNNIAYVGRPVPFPLYGTNFKNNVFYVSVNTTEPAMAHYFPHSFYRWGPDFLELHRSLEAEGNYRQRPDYKVWLSNLKRRKADYLFVYSLHQTKEIVFPIEDVWAKANPDTFELSFNNPIVHIYKIQ